MYGILNEDHGSDTESVGSLSSNSSEEDQSDLEKWSDEEGNDDAFRLQNTASISRFIWHEMEEEVVQHSGRSVGAMIRGFATKNISHGTKTKGLNRFSHSIDGRKRLNDDGNVWNEYYDKWDAD